MREFCILPYGWLKYLIASCKIERERKERFYFYLIYCMYLHLYKYLSLSHAHSFFLSPFLSLFLTLFLLLSLSHTDTQKQCLSSLFYGFNDSQGKFLRSDCWVVAVNQRLNRDNRDFNIKRFHNNIYLLFII